MGEGKDNGRREKERKERTWEMEMEGKGRTNEPKTPHCPPSSTHASPRATSCSNRTSGTLVLYVRIKYH